MVAVYLDRDTYRKLVEMKRGVPNTSLSKIGGDLIRSALGTKG
jgi:predicted CopG family antitoxin